MTDRFNVIVSLYHIAKKNDFRFKVVFEVPFKLSDYLVPNTTDWLASKSDIAFSYKTTKMLIYDDPKEDVVLKKSIRQYVVNSYTNINVISRIYSHSWRVMWGQYFNELFKPTTELLYEIENCGFSEKSYISVHMRFVNALENFEESSIYKLLTSEDQLDLIRVCLKSLDEIRRSNRLPVIVFSDSNRFLQIVKDNGFLTIGGGKVQHISHNANQDAVLKTFLDFFMISRSQKVYGVIYPNMYKSTFPSYAAAAGGCEFITIDNRD